MDSVAIVYLFVILSAIILDSSATTLSIRADATYSAYIYFRAHRGSSIHCGNAIPHDFAAIVSDSNPLYVTLLPLVGGSGSPRDLILK